jgi:predicted nucleic acid-binding protein
MPILQHNGTWTLQQMLLVSDANVFIDFEVAGLSAELFRLPHEIVVPDVLYEQELSERHAHLIEHGLKKISLDGEQVAIAYELRRKYKGAGTNDLFALVLAKNLNCPLVTGDRSLRQAAEAEGLKLMGTLTLMEHLYVVGVLDLVAIQSAYEKMKVAGRRLPEKEIASQLGRLKSGL